MTMDLYRRAVTHHVGPGGFQCDCCRPFTNHMPKSEQRRRLIRMARRALKQALRQEVEG